MSIALASLAILFSVCGTPAFAVSSLTLNVTPTLFQMSAAPLQEWTSEIKVVNPNEFDIVVYADVVNFAPQGEGGVGKFVPILEAMTEGSTLAEWITISREPVTIPREQSRQIPIRVVVPEDAAPGGHFAAVLIGTTPPDDGGELALRTSQVVSSLFFVRIAGDVVEKGDIRSFRTVDTFRTSPSATFELRFQNDGNVHLQPQGDITIFNMWGEERGFIPINHQTHFGNVLPDSIRNFRFSWDGEQSLTDIGRFKAVATLGYGLDTKVFTTRELHFWVIPLFELAVTLGGCILLVSFVFWVIKSYVRRMLILSGVDPDLSRARHKVTTIDAHTIAVTTRPVLTAPVRRGWIDFKAWWNAVVAWQAPLRASAHLVTHYKIFLGGLLIAALFVAGVWWYIDNATRDERNYDITIETPDESLTLSAEDIWFERLEQERVSTNHTASTTNPSPLTVINVSGEPGLAAEVKWRLQEAGYTDVTVAADPRRVERRTVIVFDPSVQNQAVAVSQLLDGALLSAFTATSTEPLLIYVGSDQLP